MAAFPPSFTAVEHTVPHSLHPDSLPPSSLHGLVSSPTSAAGESGDSRPVLVFVHGYPQNHTLWQPVMQWLARESDLLQTFRIVVPDLPGYGKSRKAIPDDGSHEAYSKREVGKDLLALVDAIWPGEEPKVVLIGHDRGARVSYRLAKDSPSRIVGLSVQDIVPTPVQFKRMSYENRRHLASLGMYHWIFLATPPPMAEMLLLSTPTIGPWYAHYSIASWTGPAFRSSSAPLSTPYGSVPEPEYDPTLLASWTEQYAEPAVVRGALEDYRAGATTDLEHDEADGVDGARVACPLLALWCAGLERAGNEGESVQREWESRGPEGRTRAKRVDKEGVGHFLPIEAVEELGTEVKEWVGKYF
ncbi:hypothetical protein JCM10450v2_003359 [Rhodotorula kratochvilovae]